MTPHHRIVTSACAAIMLVSASWAAASDAADAARKNFLDLAPEGTWLFATTDDFSAVRLAFEQTSLFDLWNTPQVQAFVEKPIRSMLDMISEEWNLELERDDLILPEGLVGIALFRPAEHLPRSVDGEPEIGMHYLIAADLGANIDAAREHWEGIWRLLERRDMDVREKEILGRNVYAISPPPVDRETIIAEHRQMGWMRDLSDEKLAERLEQWGRFEPEFPPQRIVFDGSLLIVCTHEPTLEDLLHGLDGQEYRALAGSESVEASLALAGGRGDLYAAIVLDRMQREALEDSPFEMLAELFDAEGALEALGLTAVRGVAMCADVGKADSLLDTRMSIYIPDGPGGLFEVLGDLGRAFETPRWVGPEAESFMQFNLDYLALIDLLRAALAATVPDEFAGEVLPAFDRVVEGTLKPIAEVVGPQTSIATWPDHRDTIDLDDEFSNFLIGIACSDEHLIENAIAPYVGMVGLTPRDFLGSRIFDLEMMGEEMVSLGLGQGYIFIGPGELVEQALRATPESPTLAQEPAYRRAVGEIPAQALMLFGYSAIKPVVENVVRTLRQPFDEAYQARRIEQWRQRYEEWDMEFNEEWFREDPPEWYDGDKVPDAELIIRYLGDTISWMQRRPDGLVMQSKMLNPSR